MEAFIIKMQIFVFNLWAILKVDRQGKHLDPKYTRGTIKHGGGKMQLFEVVFLDFVELDPSNKWHYGLICLL